MVSVMNSILHVKNSSIYKPMPINYKCRGTYNKVMLKIKTCGKSLNVFNEVVHVEKTRFFSKSASREGVSLKSHPLPPNP